MKTSMKLVGMTLAVSVLLTGCSQGSGQDNSALKNQVSQLESRVEALENALDLKASTAEIEALKTQISNLAEAASNGAQATTNLRIGFVNAEEVFVKYSGTEAAIQAYRAEKDQAEADLRNLQDQFSAGTISQNEFIAQQTELTNKLNSLDQQLTNDITQKIVEAVEVIGKEQGFDLVTVRKNVVLYYRKDGIVKDLTEAVLNYMNEALDQSNP